LILAIKKSFKNPFVVPLSEPRMSQGMNTILRSESLNLPSRTIGQAIFLFVSAFIPSIFHLYHYLFNFSDTNYLPSSKFKNIPLTTCHKGNDKKIIYKRRLFRNSVYIKATLAKILVMFPTVSKQMSR
jgi:hypothetical protein